MLILWVGVLFTIVSDCDTDKCGMVFALFVSTGDYISSINHKLFSYTNSKSHYKI